MWHVRDVPPSPPAAKRRRRGAAPVTGQRPLISGSVVPLALAPPPWARHLVFVPPAPWRRHDATVILLHGFDSTARIDGDYARVFRAALGAAGERVRWVVPEAPMRRITYLKGKEKKAWHDYYTCKGDGEPGHGVVEEGMNWKQVLEVRKELHALLDYEVELLGGRRSRVVLFGLSQGCCVGYDAALTYGADGKGALAGFVGMHGHLYSKTQARLSKLKQFPPVAALHGEEDHVISWKLAQKGWKALRDAGAVVTARVVRGLYHCGDCDGEGAYVASALRKMLPL